MYLLDASTDSGGLHDEGRSWIYISYDIRIINVDEGLYPKDIFQGLSTFAAGLTEIIRIIECQYLSGIKYYVMKLTREAQ